MNATTLANVKIHLALAAGDAAQDARLNAIIGAVSAGIEQMLRRGMESMSRTEYFDVWSGQQRFQLYGYPVAASPALQAFNDVDRAFATAMGSTLYAIQVERGLLIFDRTYVTEGFRVLKVTYTGGMAATEDALATAFPDVEYAARLQVIHEFRRRDALGWNALAVGGVSVGMEGPMEWLPRVKELLQPHRREGLFDP